MNPGPLQAGGDLQVAVGQASHQDVLGTVGGDALTIDLGSGEIFAIPLAELARLWEGALDAC